MQKILVPAELPDFCKYLIDGLHDHEEACQLKTSEILNILFPIVAHQFHQKAYNEILSISCFNLNNIKIINSTIITVYYTQVIISIFNISCCYS